MDRTTLDGPLPTLDELVAALENNGCPLLGDELAAFASTIYCGILETRIIRADPEHARTMSRTNPSADSSRRDTR